MAPEPAERRKGASIAFRRVLGGHKVAIVFCALLTSPGAFAYSSVRDAGSASGPITITQGGTYSGNWTSTSSTPAVRISTSQPVTITNSTVTNLAGGHLIDVPAATQANVTIDHVTGHGGNGRFVNIEGFKSITIRNCTLDKTGGIYLVSPVAAASVIVTRNRARNIQKGSGLRQFLQFNNVNTASPDVSWNEVINVYGQSEVEDNISVYKSSHVTVHDNYIQGAYPRNHTDSYSGSGIMLGDAGGSFNRVHDNQIVDTTNVGIGIVGGQGNRVFNNRIVSDGKLDDGTPLSAANVGIAVWNGYNDPSWANNDAYANTVGWMHSGNPAFRNDLWVPGCAGGCTSNIKLSDPLTRSTEQNEFNLWLAKLAANGVQIGA